MRHHPDPGTKQIVVFILGDRRYGLLLSAVDRIVRVVDVTSLPKAPDIVLGVVNVQGRVIPVINVRRRFQLPEREIAMTDQMVLARGATAGRARGGFRWIQSPACSNTPNRKPSGT